MNAEPKGAGASEARGYELRDVRPGWLAFWVALLVAVVAGAFLVAGALAERTDADPEPLHPMAIYRRAPAAASLQSDPATELAAYEETQREMLSTYGWIDPAAGAVRLPIERAMQLVLEEGFPVRAEPADEER